MRYYMFGMDAERPGECASELKSRGFSAVVSPPGAEAAQAALAQGLEVWGCVGAFSMREGDPEEYLAEDVFGHRRRWFGSGCPNEPALRERGFAQIEKWKQWGAAGVLADGARFASPCPGTELFASCFCPRCMALGKEMGYDMNGMRRRVRLYMTMPDLLPPADWLRFREECTGRWFAAFAQRVRDAGMQSGSFVFAPGLAPLVGQAGAALSDLQIVAPMLYRRYRPEPGIATLNDEYASLLRLYAARGDRSPKETIRAHTGVALPCADAKQLREEGFAPEAVGAAVSRAREACGAVLAPILQLEDELLSQSIEAAAKAGADAIGFFAYTKAGLAALPELHDFNTTRGMGQ